MNAYENGRRSTTISALNPSTANAFTLQETLGPSISMKRQIKASKPM
jgi:hypothetical protein